MSGGGKKTAATKAEAKPSPVQYQQIQPFMPGMQNMLAQQLTGGFGGNPQDLMAYMNQLYAPMNMPLQSVIMSPTPPTEPTPARNGQKKNGQVLPEKNGYGWA
jgi:hypothetical protein